MRLTAICSLREMTQRSQLFKTAIIATAAAMITNLAFDWMRNSSLTQIDYSSYNYLMVNGVTLLFAYPLPTTINSKGWASMMAQMSTMVMCAINAVRESRNTRIKMGTMAYGNR